MIGRPAMSSPSPTVNLKGSQPLSDAMIDLKYASRTSAGVPCVAKVMRGGAIITPDLLKLNSTDICIPSRVASAAGGDQQERSREQIADGVEIVIGLLIFCRVVVRRLALYRHLEVFTIGISDL